MVAFAGPETKRSPCGDVVDSRAELDKAFLQRREGPNPTTQRLASMQVSHRSSVFKVANKGVATLTRPRPPLANGDWFRSR